MRALLSKLTGGCGSLVGNNWRCRKLLARDNDFGGSGISFGTGFLQPLGLIPPEASSGLVIEGLFDIMIAVWDGLIMAVWVLEYGGQGTGERGRCIYVVWPETITG